MMNHGFHGWMRSNPWLNLHFVCDTVRDGFDAPI